ARTSSCACRRSPRLHDLAMHATLLALRIVHIAGGVFWAGTVLFFTIFLEPSVRAAGPEGAKVIRELQARRYGTILPLIALATILSGGELLRRLFPGGPSSWIASRQGLTLVIGAVSAIIALLLGVTVVLPTVKKVGALTQRLGTEPEGPGRAA